MDIKLIQLKSCGDDRGSLIALEEKSIIPFEIKRVYYMFKTAEGVRRGFHAHKTLKQVAIAVRGSCKFMLDNGIEKIHLTLNHPDQGLLIESFMWREMYDFSPDCVLMVLADQIYDEADYVRNYEQFIELAAGSE